MIGVKLFAIETEMQKRRRANAMTKRCMLGFPFSVNQRGCVTFAPHRLHAPLLHKATSASSFAYSSGSLAIFTAILLASLLSNLAAERRPGSSSK
jgi:hypothetical protein